ncbi:MAG: hypothetical protein MUC87_06945 [Bacteroidia bacterium]|jgi:hypothetical protein|nr:hypothetical protein [Bacteroidia bacterium]
MNDDLGAAFNRSNNPQENNAVANVSCFELYDSPQIQQPPRSIELVQGNGKSSFDYYSYLVGGTYDPQDSKITLTFTTKNVVITGANLQPIYEAIMLHQVRTLRTANPRYAALQDDGLPMVVGIEIFVNI